VIQESARGRGRMKNQTFPHEFQELYNFERRSSLALTHFSFLVIETLSLPPKKQQQHSLFSPKQVGVG